MQSAFLGIVFVIMAGCQSSPTAPRTGHVIDVPILESGVPGTIAVNPGDEVRWVNKTPAPVRVIVVDRLSDKDLSCKSRFGSFTTPADTANMAGGDTAGLCFRQAGMFRYVVRMESRGETGEISFPGVIKVGEPAGQAAHQTNDPTVSAQ